MTKHAVRAWEKIEPMLVHGVIRQAMLLGVAASIERSLGLLAAIVITVLLEMFLTYVAVLLLPLALKGFARASRAYLKQAERMLPLLVPELSVGAAAVILDSDAWDKRRTAGGVAGDGMPVLGRRLLHGGSATYQDSDFKDVGGLRKAA